MINVGTAMVQWRGRGEAGGVLGPVLARLAQC